MITCRGINNLEPGKELTWVDKPEVIGGKPQDGRLVHPFVRHGDGRHDLAQNVYEIVDLVPPVLLGLVSRLPVRPGITGTLYTSRLFSFLLC